MSLLASRDWKIAEAIAEIGFKNPFLAERIELEKRALGQDFVGFQPLQQYRSGYSVSEMFPNATALRVRSDQLLAKMRDQLLAHQPATERELEVYENLVFYQLYARYMSSILDLPAVPFLNRPQDDFLACYGAFVEDYQWFLRLPERNFPSNLDPDTLFAGLFQVERAFFHIFRHIVGTSQLVARLRATIWQSIFTHDMRRYLRSLRQHLGRIPTLITGPSGTGKELVAQSIAYSRFVDFDPKKRQFVTNYADCFVGLNLSAIAPTLIESELFGHVPGAFTGAATERQGYLDESICSRWGTIFLDEIGELAPQIQVKLLRVLQNREFQRVGDPQTRPFVGKIVTATNRNLAAEMEAGRFREDLYYRLCADRIETPSLHAQLREAPGDIEVFIQFIAARLLPELPEEANELAREVIEWVQENLGTDYAWPGNFRELEQCVRNIMIRGTYQPPERQPSTAKSRLSDFLRGVEEAELNREELLTGYMSLVYAKLGSYRAAGRLLEVDWRTVKETVDIELAQRLAGENSD